ncbi:clan AA aspartic protease [Candidatus Peregrinibacteria bacterium]|nr:clan AA aspartic protease [Candidatus Peregrinibacteria bacterium]
MMLNGEYDNGSPMLRLKIGEDKREINLLVDTGFNGELLLSKELVKQLKFTSIGSEYYKTASGEKVLSEVYMGSIDWFDEQRSVTILSTQAELNLIGMELLGDSRVIMERRKGVLTISK